MFDAEGHVQTTPAQLLVATQANLDQAVKELALSGTPRAFDTFSEYRAFIEAVGDHLRIHPRTIVVRGSAHFGFSPTPQPAKIWGPFRRTAIGREKPSDIDLAVVDVDYFNRMDLEVREWEGRQRRPKVNEAGERFWLRREQLRHWSICPDDEALPPNTCVPHARAMAELSRRPLCGGVARKVTAYVYRDWWCLQNKCAFDLEQIRDLVGSGALRAP